jgi:hypothetical protein
MIRRGLRPGLLAGRTTVRRQRPAREQPDPFLVHRTLGPSFSDQHVGVMWGEFEPISDCRVFEVHAVDHLGVLPDESNGGEVMGPVSGMSPPSLTRGRTRGVLRLPFVIPIHSGANTLIAKNMPFVDGTK